MLYGGHWLLGTLLLGATCFLSPQFHCSMVLGASQFLENLNFSRAGRGYNFFRCGYDTAALQPDLVRLRLCGSISGPPSANFDFHFATFFSGANPLNWHFRGGAPDVRDGICSFKENGGWRELRGEMESR